MKIYLGSLVIILIATTISASDISPALIEECRKIGEVARFGGHYDCDKTCDSPPRQLCHHIGMTRCFCPEGKVRITYRGRCIPPSECPARNKKFPSNTFSRGKCPRKNRQRKPQPPHIPPQKKEECRNKGEVAEWGLGEDCDKTCDGPPRRMCHLMLHLRCYCPKGQVRIKSGDRCIPEIQCPVRNGRKFLGNASNRDISPALIEKCRKTGEVARWGGYYDCDETCEGSPRMCHHVGMLRCFCPNGKVRITYRGRCIPPSECPPRNGQKFLSNRDIDPNLVYTCLEVGEVIEWGKPEHCDETCEGKPRVCHYSKKEFRCACPEGKVRRKLRGACIPRSGCPGRNG